MLKAIVCGLLLAGVTSGAAMAGSIDFQGNISQYSCTSTDTSDDCKAMSQQISHQLSQLREHAAMTGMQASLHNQLASSEVSRLGASSAVLTISYN